MKPFNAVLLATSVFGLAFLPQNSSAGIPSGSLQVAVTDAVNRIWDASSIDNLQHPDFGISDEDTSISFDAPFIQTGAGKLVGAGPTLLDVTSPIFVGTINAVYKVTGSVTSAQGIARFTYTGSAKGLASAGGQTSTLAGTFAARLTIAAPSQSVSGDYTSTGSAAGYGTVRESEPLDITWSDVTAAMGNGTWNLEMQLTNDGVKKIGGTAIVTLSSGAELNFVVKGVYKSKTNTSVLVLSGAGVSKGSTLKVSLTGSTVTSIAGKVSGQAVKWVL